MGYRLGVDLGTTFTSAAVFTSGMPTMIGLGNRAMQIPSVLFMKPDGQFLVGEAAERRAAAEPDRVAREFKRRLGDQVPILVAGSPHSPQALQARLLRWVVDQVTQRQGSTPDHITLTHPANWGPYKRDLFDQTIRMADITGADICTEPEAAATLYAARNVLADGQTIAVYDLGGGTFDAAVLRKTTTGFDLLGHPEGIEQLGGIDFDEAVFHHVLATLGDQITTLDNTPDLTAGLARLRRDCVDAKEALSADTETVIPVTLPGLTTSIRLIRDELEDMIGPTITDTVAAMRRVLTSAHLQPDDLTAIVLTGGSSRIPLVSQQLGTAFNRPLALDTHPKHDVALGAALHGKTLHPATTPPPPAPVVTPPNTPTTTPPPPSEPQPGRAVATGSARDRGDLADPAPPEAADPQPVRTRRRRGAKAADSVAAPSAPAPPGTPTTPEPEPAVPDPSRRPRRPRRGGAILIGVVVLLVVGAAVVLLTRGSGGGHDGGGGGGPAVALPDTTMLVTSKTDAGVTTYRLDLTSGKATPLPLPTPPAGSDNIEPVISPDRTTFLYQVGEEGHPNPARVGTFGGEDRSLLTGTSPCSSTFRPAFSPSGQELAIVCPDASGKLELLVIGLDGTLHQRLLDDGTAFGDPTWTDDGHVIFLRKNRAHGPKSLWSVAADGPQPGTPQRFPVGHGSVARPDWSRGGLLFVRTNADATGDQSDLGDIVVLDLATGRQTQATSTGDVKSAAWSPDGRSIAFTREDAKGAFTLWTMPLGGTPRPAPWPVTGSPGGPAWGSR